LARLKGGRDQGGRDVMDEKTNRGRSKGPRGEGEGKNTKWWGGGFGNRNIKNVKGAKVDAHKKG